MRQTASVNGVKRITHSHQQRANRPPPPAAAYSLILLGAGLRFIALFQDIRFHPDEALFSTFARAAALNGDWWLPGALDKPPLVIYLNALAQVALGPGEWVSRLPGTLAGVLLLPVFYALACQLYRDRRVALVALLLLALSPLVIAYDGSAFTDSPMLLCLALSLLLAVRGHGLWAGVWLGLGFAAKQQAVLYLPLVIGLAWLLDRLQPLRLLAGFGAVIALLLAWDALRPGVSFFALAAANNNPGRFIRSAEIAPRLAAWLSHAGHFTGWLTAPLSLLALAGIINRTLRQPRQRTTAIDLLLLAYVAGYGWLHWLVAFNTYDRYLLPLVLPLLLLFSRGIVWLWRGWPLWPLCALLILALLPAALTPPRSREHQGIDAVAAFLRDTPVATVIYDHWLGWQLDYYLGQWHDKRRVYYPSPAPLVHDALLLCEDGVRYFPVPRRQPAGRWLAALETAGFGVNPVYETDRYIIYSLTPPWVAASAAANASPDRYACEPP